jgi:FkbM family methyltransferase
VSDTKKYDIKIGDKMYSVVSDDAYLDGIGKNFEPQMVDLFGSLIRKDSIVLDIGANIGLTTILFSELAERVISFEPSPTTFNLLVENVSQANSQNVRLLNYALGAEKIESEITYSPANRAGGFVSNQTKASTGHVIERIQIIKLDDAFAEYKLPRVDFVKIDVEGFEKFVIQGARKVLDKFNPVVVMELNHWCLNAFQRITVPDFFDFLTEIFPYVYAVDGRYYLDIHDESQRYIAMYRHIVLSKYSNLVCAFSKNQLEKFHQSFSNG